MIKIVQWLTCIYLNLFFSIRKLFYPLCDEKLVEHLGYKKFSIASEMLKVTFTVEYKQVDVASRLKTN